MFNVETFRQMYEKRLLARLYHLGRNVICPYCQWQGRRFLPAGAKHTPNRLCPRCRSLEGYRMLLLYLQQEKTLQHPLRVLDMASQNCLRHYLQQLPSVTYISSDLATPGAMVFSDLTQMGMQNDAFDLIVCLHILEHIPDDRAAFDELRRILAPGGYGMLMVPIRGEHTLEDPQASPADYECFYGQHDHVRWYGLDIVDRMRAVGLQVEILYMFDYFGSQVCQRYALYGDDRYFFRFSKTSE